MGIPHIFRDRPGAPLNPRWGWALAAVGVAVGYQAYGWPGVALAATIIAFWLLLQFSRAMRVMRAAAARPIGLIDSAVMLQAKLQSGMPMLQIVTLTRSLGVKLADEPETWRWHDAGGDAVRVELKDGRCERWTLERAAADPAP